MKIGFALSAIASLGLLAGVAFAQTSPAQAPSSEGKPTGAETGGPTGAKPPAQPGETMGGNEGQNVPAGTMPGPAASGQPAGVQSGGQAGAVEGGNLPAGAVATRHIAVVSAALVSANANANMLKQIAASPATYDPDHAQLFVGNIKQAVTQADEYLSHLTPMAHGKAASDAQAIQARLDKVKAMIPKMEGELANPKEVSSTAGQCANQLHGAIAPLKSMSGSMHAKVTFGSAG